MSTYQATDQPCWCVRCRPITMGDMRMVVCPTCGDKRCIHAANHDATCAKDDIYAHNSWVQKAIATRTTEPSECRECGQPTVSPERCTGSPAGLCAGSAKDMA